MSLYNLNSYECCLYIQVIVHKTSAHLMLRNKLTLNFHTGRLAQRPRLVDVVNQLFPINHKVYLLAIQLGLNIEEIVIITRENPTDFQSQTVNILRLWLRKDKNCTWASLIKALRSQAVGEYRQAKNIEDRLSNGNITTIHHDKNTL